MGTLGADLLAEFQGDQNGTIPISILIFSAALICSFIDCSACSTVLRNNQFRVLALV